MYSLSYFIVYQNSIAGAMYDQQFLAVYIFLLSLWDTIPPPIATFLFSSVFSIEAWT